MITSNKFASARISTCMGMGGFLNPPGHPEHTSHVETDLERRPDNRGALSLSAAVDCEWIVPGIRNEAKRKLDEWSANRPALDSVEVQAWVRQVLGYFKGCYGDPNKNGDIRWNASELIIDKRDPLSNTDDHAGVRAIRQYYPEFTPTAEHFAQARWGSQ
jgi:hypothetical protein